ncbi:DUF2326 domain-containing protein [Xylella fastidiosa subsp. multiplex]|uniref:DUF2326 domain-containing protein n=1 Tax=Xylella fastidiosa subsp. multiplex TaxID=644357 RepID=A0AAW6HS63_XYLFS|nr:DUF2326 domain-containing protein [Xylella fastidiosa]MDC6407352.1 DUF2326 domain-containing protein [Xylella fastidiosa subsp. multiplex]MDD0936772.1 DUF2326 domain-containing protein [Xylella fastidiosa subsp. multiplex]
MAEIRLPENRNKDTHNLGKTTLGRILDFCFLSKKDGKFFLFKQLNLFKDFVFFLEIELKDDTFVTIRRSVKEATKTAFKRHEANHQDFSSLSLAKWDHQDVPLERSRELLDGLLDWRALKPWSYRKALAYLLRSQEDFREVFQLRKFSFKDVDWKPFLAHLMGLDGKLMVDHYAKEQVLSKKREMEQNIQKELGGSLKDSSKIEGMLLLKQKDVEKKRAQLSDFDFRNQDKECTKKVVDEVDKNIAELNIQRYSLNYNKNKVQASLQEDQILFNTDEAQRLFNEAGVLFQGQIKKDFQQLIAFNQAITNERRSYLQEELTEIEKELKRVNSRLNALGKTRSDMLSFLNETDAFIKYKQLSNEIATLQADITLLEQQRYHLRRLQELRMEIRSLRQECDQLQLEIEANVEKQNSDQESTFSTIRLFFSEIVEEVIDHKALLSVVSNKAGHLEFKAEILDESGNATSADLGHTYRKLLCVAFDMAVLRAYLNRNFPRFVYHDGVLESLDNRKKENLLEVIRRYVDMGVQPIITLIDSDLPARSEGSNSIFTPDEIVVTLHDESDHGRLFKMKGW